jgi:hypothetical protein
MHELADYPSIPGWKEGETSREAAEAIALRARTLRRMCFNYLTTNPFHTADEVAGALGESPFAIRPRISELRKQGLVVNDGRGVNISGRPAHRWRVTTLVYTYIEEEVAVRQKSELRSYQQRVIKHLYEHDEAMAVLKMGAGKTASVLTAIAELIDDGVIEHALVVAPKRVANMVWPAEIEGWEHLRHLKYAVLNGSPRRRADLLNETYKRQVTIIGIDNVQWLVDILKPLSPRHPIFNCLVIDETSKLKDPTSKRGKALFTIADRFKLRWGMTGTPIPNSLLDLFAPMKIISNGELWGKSFYKWQQAHFYPLDRNGYRWQVLPGHDAGLLADAASLSIALGEGEMPDLPELSILVEGVVLPEEARRLYHQMEYRLFAGLTDAQIVAISQAVATGKLAQMANGFVYDDAGAEGVHPVHGEKALGLEELVDGLGGEPLIIVYEYKEDLAMIRRLFGDVPYLGAGVSDKAAQDAVEAWNRGELPLFAVHPASGGHGLNLQAGGSRMAWIAPTWSAELWDQTIARLHRPGQAAHVMVHVCSARNTVDELKQLRVIGKLSAQEAFATFLASSSASRRRAA